MSQFYPAEETARLPYKLDGSIFGAYPVRDYKNYIVPPFTPIIVLQGQASGVLNNALLATTTLAANQVPLNLRLKKILVDQIPPPGVSVSYPNIYNMIQIVISQAGQTFVVYSRYVNPTQPFNDSQDLSGEDAFAQLLANATATISVYVTNQATGTAYNIELVFTAPLTVG